MGDGRTVAFVGSVPGRQENLILTSGTGEGARTLDSRIQTRLLENMTAGIPVDRWLGDQPTPQMGLDTPHIRLRWFEPEGASTESIPATDKGTWKSLVVGARRADGKYYAMLEDGLLNLTFLLDPINLPVLTDLLPR